ncbi:hypothetical protein [Streptosporangium longisporum]|uniref:Uncharacterized protein n=1 Tax=Streptosporangium longisporum TaxID=46187 RepID=A0ABP6KFH6_9ACTN
MATVLTLERESLFLSPAEEREGLLLSSVEEREGLLPPSAEKTAASARPGRRRHPADDRPGRSPVGTDTAGALRHADRHPRGGRDAPRTVVP